MTTAGNVCPGCGKPVRLSGTFVLTTGAGAAAEMPVFVGKAAWHSGCWIGRAAPPATSPGAAPHPWYGPCDALGPNGECVECLKQRATSPGADDERLTLLPCPFCGAIAYFGEVTHDPDDPNSGGNFIACSRCIATTDLRFSCKEDARPLLAAEWNRRTTLVAGSQYLNMPTRRACDAALQEAAESLQLILAHSTDFMAKALAKKTISRIEAIVGPGITTGEPK